jgi:hypothetical protein
MDCRFKPGNRIDLVTGGKRLFTAIVLRPLPELRCRRKKENRDDGNKNSVNQYGFCPIQHQATYEKNLGTEKSSTPKSETITPTKAANAARTRQGELIRYDAGSAHAVMARPINIKGM